MKLLPESFSTWIVCIKCFITWLCLSGTVTVPFISVGYHSEWRTSYCMSTAPNVPFSRNTVNCSCRLFPETWSFCEPCWSLKTPCGSSFALHLYNRVHWTKQSFHVFVTANNGGNSYTEDTPFQTLNRPSVKRLQSYAPLRCVDFFHAFFSDEGNGDLTKLATTSVIFSCVPQSHFKRWAVLNSIQTSV